MTEFSQEVSSSAVMNWEVCVLGVGVADTPGVTLVQTEPELLAFCGDAPKDRHSIYKSGVQTKSPWQPLLGDKCIVREKGARSY